jgi:galactokinase
MNYRALASDFHEAFSRDADRFFFSPGRINLLGEHTEYSGGHIIQCATTCGIYGVVSRRNDRLIRLFSKNYPEEGVTEFAIDELAPDYIHSWVNYLKGMLHYFVQKGYPFESGFDLFVYGNLPQGAGLSSTKSLLLLMAEIIRSLYKLDIDPIELVEAGRAMEKYFSGVNGWVRDYYAIAMGKSNHAIVIDCHTLDYRYVPLELGDYKLVLMNTNSHREMTEITYNKRIEECELALSQLQTFINIMSIAELSEEQFNLVKHFIGSDLLRKRAQHIVTENQRTIKAVQELRSGNLSVFGQLLNESHYSLRDNFEITGIELDTLVNAAWQYPGILGARMTGAGLGGCVYAVVEKSEIENFIDSVGETYRSKIGNEVTFAVTDIGEGVKELNVAEVLL